MPGVPLIHVNILQRGTKKTKKIKFFVFFVLLLITFPLLNIINYTEKTKTAALYKVSNLKNIHPDFVGRQKYFDTIEETFADNDGKEMSVAVLWGEGGIGKSEIAVALASRYLKKLPVVYWIESGLRETYDQSYRNLAKELHIPFLEREPLNIIRRKVHDHLEQSDTPWLLIFDNAEKTLELPEKGKGNILITSRHHKPWDSFPCLHVLSFSEEEGIALLQNVTQTENTKDQKELIKKLDHSPLALNQAAHYIAKTPEMSEKKYLTLLSENQLELLQSMPSDSRYPHGLAVSWQITLDRLQKRHPEVVDWLNFCSYLYPDAIPADWIEKWLSTCKSEKDPLQIELRTNDIMHTLSDFSLVRYDKRNETLSMHRLKQEITRNLLPNITAEVAAFLAKDTEGLEGIREIKQHPECWAKLASWEANSSWFLENTPCTQSEHIANIQNVLGNWSWMKADFQNAQKFHRQALENRKILFGTNDYRVANSMNSLAHSLEKMGTFGEARDLRKSALKIQREILGEEHPDIATTLYHLSWVMERLGQYQYDETKEVAMEALRMQKKLLGEKHPDVAYSTSNVAWIFHKLGEEEEAKKYAKEALRLRKKIYGEQHPMVAASMNILGCISRSLGENEEAEKLFKQALEMRKKLLGEEHPDVATSLYDLSWALKNQEYYTDAKKILKQSLHLRRKFFGNEHSYVSDTLHLMGEIHLGNREYEEAKTLFTQAMEMRKTCYGKEHPKITQSIYALATLLQKEEQYDKAIALHQEVLQSRKKRLGEEHEEVATSLHQIGLCLHAQKKNEEAIQYLAQSLQILCKTHQQNDRKLTHYLKDYIKVSYTLDNHDPTTQQTVYTLCEPILGKEHMLIQSLLQIRNEPL